MINAHDSIFLKLENPISWGSLFALCSGLYECLHAKADIFKNVNIDILFPQKMCQLWYITCFLPNLIPV